jgi:hypothetical protein
MPGNGCLQFVLFHLILNHVKWVSPSLSHRGRPIIIGAVPIGSNEAFSTAWKPTFENYLTDTVGVKYNPPLNFTFVSLTTTALFDMAGSGNVDFIYSNPSVYACLESEYAGTYCISCGSYCFILAVM